MPCVRAKNLLAVRVLNPTHEPIDGIRLKQTASGVKNTRITGNMAFNAGGIVDSVAVILNPAAFIDDVFVLSDWKTGRVQVRLESPTRCRSRRSRWRGSP